MATNSFVSSENFLSHEWAEIILEMEEVCYNEDLGPENQQILDWIIEHYPDLKEKYSRITGGRGFV